MERPESQRLLQSEVESPPASSTLALVAPCKEPCMDWMTLPAQRKSRALKKPCVMRWKTAPKRFPVPMASIMNPSWLIVE